MEFHILFPIAQLLFHCMTQFMNRGVLISDGSMDFQVECLSVTFLAPFRFCWSPAPLYVSLFLLSCSIFSTFTYLALSIIFSHHHNAQHLLKLWVQVGEQCTCISHKKSLSVAPDIVLAFFGYCRPTGEHCTTKCSAARVLKLWSSIPPIVLRMA